MNKTYKNIGIGLLIVNIYFLYTELLRFLIALIFVPNFYSILSAISFQGDFYKTFLFYLFMSLDSLFFIWGIKLSVYLIRKNTYTKQLLYWVYTFAVIKILFFILYIPTGNYSFIDLIIGLIVLMFVIFAKENSFSKLIKGKNV